MRRNGFSIRKATDRDTDAISETIAASYDLLYRGWYSDDLLAAVLPAMSRANPELISSGRYYVAVRGNHIVGCGGWSLKDPKTGEVETGIAHVRHFATHPDHTRKGIARALLERCVSECRTGGISLIKCNSSLPAEPFYAAMGFSRISTENVLAINGRRIQAVLMELELP